MFVKIHSMVHMEKVNSTLSPRGGGNWVRRVYKGYFLVLLTHLYCLDFYNDHVTHVVGNKFIKV